MMINQPRFGTSFFQIAFLCGVSLGVLACDSDAGDDPDVCQSPCAGAGADVFVRDLSDAGVANLADVWAPDVYFARDVEGALPDANVFDASTPDASTPDASTPDVFTPTDPRPIVVGVGWQGLTMLSIDEGETWCQTGLMNDPHDDLFRGAGVHDGLIIGAHAGRENRGSLWTTRDGWRWTALHKTNADENLPDNPTGQWYAEAAFGNGTWVGMGGCGTSALSSDGLEWVDQGWQFEGCRHVRNLHFAEGVFVASVQFSREGENVYDWYQSPTGLDGSWTLRQSNADAVVNHDGQSFVGAENGQKVVRGRGVCFYSSGFGEGSRIFRSTAADCSNAEVAATTPAKMTDFVFSTTSAEALAPNAMPEALRNCLYP